MEYFDIVDDRGIPTGEIIERKQAHREGVQHRTSHVWIMRRKEGRYQILLQKRCADKDSFPGCYDISSAGHIPAGDDFISSAIRELKEELGVDIQPEQLINCGLFNKIVDEVFHGEEFHDRQVSRIFLLNLDMEPEEFTVQKEEIDEVCWFDYEECKKAVQEDLIPNCIFLDELEILEEHINDI